MEALELRQMVRACRACDLHAQCSGPVPPELAPPGSPLVVAEAPGRREDRQVRPLVGLSGRQLRRWLADVGFATGERPEAESDPLRGRSEPVFAHPRPISFANTVCCWPIRTPPTPSADEIRACQPNLQATLDYLKPSHVLLVGNVALQAFLPKKSIGQWRGMWWRHGEGGPFMLATYHPAAVLRGSAPRSVVLGDIEAFAFYSLGHFDPPIGSAEVGRRMVNWQQERLI